MPKDPTIKDLPLDALMPVDEASAPVVPQPLPLDALSPVKTVPVTEEPKQVQALPADALHVVGPMASTPQASPPQASPPPQASSVADVDESKSASSEVSPAASAAPEAAPDDDILSLMRDPLDASFINDKLRRHVDPASPAKMRMLAAKNMVPMAPREQAHVLYQLTLDEHPKIAAAARESFSRLGGPIIEAVIGDNSVAPQVLGRMAALVVGNVQLTERLLLNKSTPDLAFVYVASETASEPIIEIVANNQQRLLRDHDIVRSLKKNPSTLRSTLERVIDFMVRNGVLLRDLPEFAESFSRLNQADLDAFAEKVEVPFSLLAPEEQERLRRQGKAPAAPEQQEVDLSELPQGDELDELDLEELEMLAAAEAEEEDQQQQQSKEKKSALELLRTMTIAQQVKLAMQGSKEVRGILLRSTVRMVSEAAVRSPRITEMEVVSVASSRSVQDSVIRIIAKNREWTRLYQIKLALCNNPKAPISVSMGFLRGLRLHDLKAISKSKNIPSALTLQAKRLVKQKSGIKGD